MAEQTVEHFNDLLSEWGWRMDAVEERWHAPDGIETHYIAFHDIPDAIGMAQGDELTRLIEKWGARP